MRKPLTDEDLLERASVDGRVAFAAAAFALAAGLVALLDRIGVPETAITLLGPATVLIGLSLIGILVRSMRVSRFYAAGRAVPSAYAGLATACLALALFAPFLPPLASGASAGGLLAGFGLGLALLAFGTGPLLRKTGAFSLPDLLASRFPSLALRLALVAVITAVGLLIALAGMESAVRALVLATDMQRGTAALLVGLIAALIVLPGGMSGVVWAAAGTAGVLIAAFALPLIVLIVKGDALPFPIFGDQAQWTAAAARLAQWGEAVGADAADGGILLIPAVALGVASLGPLLAPSVTTFDSIATRRCGTAAFGWVALAIGMGAVIMAMAALDIDARIVGQRADRLPPYAYLESARGLLTICDAQVKDAAAALKACSARPGFTGTLRPQDVVAGGYYLLLGFAELRGLGPAFHGLLAAAAIAIAMILAAAGFQTASTAIGHDAFYRVRDTSALTSRRLATTRLVALAFIVLVTFAIARHSLDPRAAIAMALAFSTAAIAPLLPLSLVARATGIEATIALLVGLATAEFIIILGGDAPSLARLSASAVVSCIAALAAGLAASMFRRPDPASHAGAFVHGVLHGETEVLNPDRGA